MQVTTKVGTNKFILTSKLHKKLDPLISGINLLKSWQSNFENSCINQIHEVSLKISKSKIIFLSSFKGLSVFCDFKFELKPLSPILLMRNHLRYSIFLWLFLCSLWSRTIWGPTEHNIQLMIRALLASHCALFVASSSFGAVPSMSTVLSLSHTQGTETPNQSTFFYSEFYRKTIRCKSNNGITIKQNILFQSILHELQKSCSNKKSPTRS